MDNFRLFDLVDLTAVQKMAESHYQSTGMPIGIIDAFDNSILVGVGWQDICLNFHRSHPDSAKRCQASDNYIKENLKIGESCKYKCKNGLWDIGIPIVVREKHVATLFIGQFFYEGEKPNKSFFIQQATRFGYDLDEYLEALERVRVFKHEKVEDILDYDNALATFLMDLAEKSLSKKIADNELRKAQNYLSNIINSMPSVLIGLDANEKITQWNQEAELTTGLSFKNVLSRPFNEVYPRLRNKLPDIKEAIDNKQIITRNKVLFTDERATRYVDITIFPIIDDGSSGAVIRIDDATDRVRLEEMLVQSEKMLSVGGLAAGMAHEINNPLAGMLQNTSVLENRLLKDLPANQKAADAAGTTLPAIRHYMTLRKLPVIIDNIRESGTRAAAIVKNMLSFARKSENVVSIENLGTLLDQVLDLLKTDYDMKKHYDFKQLRIVRKYDPNVSTVPCEASKIQQVFMNILKNGAEAMVETEAPPTFILRVATDGPWVRVEIEDNGPGMDAATRRCVFEPFFTTKPKGKGTGLGLSVSYFIITEGHGGEMSVHAADGGGTRFVIRLPKAGKKKCFDTWIHS